MDVRGQGPKAEGRKEAVMVNERLVDVKPY